MNIRERINNKLNLVAKRTSKLSEPNRLLKIVDEISEIQKYHSKDSEIYSDLQLAKQFAFDSAMEISEVRDD